MRAIAIAAATTAMLVSGSAYAKCSTADLMGTWVLDVEIGGGVWSQCHGSLTKAGKLAGATCAYMYSDHAVVVKLALDVTNSCKVSGTVKLTVTPPIQNFPLPLTNAVEGYTNGSQIVAMTLSGNPSFNGRLTGVRLGD